MKRTFEEYCLDKFSEPSIAEETMIAYYGEAECAHNGRHLYDEEDQKYDREFQGFTQEQVEQKLIWRGAGSFVDYEYELFLSEV